MALSLEQIAALPLPVVEKFLPDWIASHVEAAPEILDGIRRDVRERIQASHPDELAAMQAAYLAAGAEYRLYPAAPLARDCTRRFMAHLLAPGEIVGRDALARFLAEGPRRRLIVCNHLSYTDTQITDAVLVAHGLASVADRLVAIAGPKVYTDAWRRMAAIALNTRKTAQSSAVASEQDALGAREIAVIARDTIADCERLMDEGSIILLYPEGTRSRTGQLQPFLRAAARYTSLSDLQILPLAQTGTDRVYPIGSTTMFPAPVRLSFGEAFRAEDHPGKSASLDEAWRRVAALLPEGYRP